MSEEIAGGIQKIWLFQAGVGEMEKIEKKEVLGSVLSE